MKVQKSATIYVAFATCVLMLSNPGVAPAATPPCGSVITSDTTLDSDMNCPGRALRFSPASNKVTLDCDGHTVSTTNDRIISANSVNKLTIKNCVLMTAHTGGRAMVMTDVTNSLIKNNVIITTGQSGRGIELRGNSRNNLVVGNVVQTQASGANGLRFQSNSNNNVVKSNLFQAEGSIAVNIESSSGNKLINNTLDSPVAYLVQGKFALQNGGLGVDSSGNVFAVENNWGSSAGNGLGLGTATAFFQVDPVTGDPISVMPLLEGGADVGFGFDALEILSDGTVLALTGFDNGVSKLYEIDPATGEVAAIFLNTTAVSGELNGLESNGMSTTSVYATTNTGELANIDLNTGVVSEIGESGTGWTGLSIHPTTGDAYAVSRRFSEATRTAHLYRIDLGDGSILEHIGDTLTTSISDIDFAPDGTLYGSWSLETIDISTGEASTVGGFGQDPLEPLSQNNKIKNTLMEADDGSIRFPGTILLPTVERTGVYSGNFEIAANTAWVDSADIPYLDETALIRLDNLGGEFRSLLVDPEDDGTFEPCASPQCEFITFDDGTLEFEVSGFTTYSSEENLDPDSEFINAVVLAEIKHLQGDSELSKKARKRLKKAVKKAKKSLKDLRKNKLKKALQGFSKTAKELDKAENKGAPVEDLITHLVDISRDEAQAAIDAAVIAGEDPGVIAKAEGFMADAEDKLAEGNPAKAIKLFRKAWNKVS